METPSLLDRICDARDALKKAKMEGKEYAALRPLAIAIIQLQAEAEKTKTGKTRITVTDLRIAQVLRGNGW